MTDANQTKHNYCQEQYINKKLRIKKQKQTTVFNRLLCVLEVVAYGTLNLTFLTN